MKISFFFRCLAHNENNVQLWEEKRRKEMEEAHH